MRNSAALDQYDGVGDELVGDEGELHELELEGVDEWEDESTVGDAPPPEPPAETTTAPAVKKAAPAKKAAAKKATRGVRK